MEKAIDGVWEKIHSTRGWGQYPTEHIIRFVARNYYSKDRACIKILDYGCGQGAHTWFLAREGFDTYAFDGSESAVRKCQERLDLEGLKAHLNVFDGKEIDYEDDFFDAVVDSVCIYSNRMEDIIYMYENVYRILLPGGNLITTAFNTDTTGYGCGEMIEPGTYTNIDKGFLKECGTVHFWDKGEQERLLSEIGFQDIMTDYSMYTLNGDNVALNIVTATKKTI